MQFYILAVPLPAVASGIAIGAAVFVAGVLFLRWYRMRQEFVLIRMAIEKGMAPFPTGLPQWLLSLRQGVMIVTLGVGLGLVGAAGWKLVPDVPVPAAAVEVPQVVPIIDAMRPPTPRPPDPKFDAWRQAQDQRTVCMAAVGCGVVLVLLGLARISFVPAERRFAAQLSPAPGQSVSTL